MSSACVLAHLIYSFGQISIGHKADWWLAKPDKCLFYKAAEKAIEQQWNQKPLYIREGGACPLGCSSVVLGSIPAVPFLENAYQACVVHIPMGQVIKSV
jgi:di- and tripeptidase